MKLLSIMKISLLCGALSSLNNVHGMNRDKDLKKVFICIQKNKIEKLEKILHKYRDDKDFINEHYNPSTETYFKETPLLFAVRLYKRKVVKLLLKNKNIDINKSNALGNPLSYALQSNDVEYDDENCRIKMVELLLEYKVDVNIRNYYDNTPLFLTKNLVMMKLLLKNKAIITIQNIDGDTPLHKAVNDDNARGIKVLLKYGSDVTIKNKNHQTPYDIAKKNNNKKIMKLFKE